MIISSGNSLMLNYAREDQTIIIILYGIDLNYRKMNFLQQFKDLGSKLVAKTLLREEKKKIQAKYTFPSSISLAKKHRKAARVKSTIKKQGSTQDNDKCPCCGLHINDFTFSVRKTHTTPILEDQKCFVTSSVALFFTFIKTVILMLIIRTILVDIFNIITSLLNDSFCSQKCSNEFWSLSSLIQKYDKSNLIQITDILSLITICVLLIYFQGVRKLQYTIYCNIDQDNQTEDDFTIFVQNIPILNFPSKSTGSQLTFRYQRDLEFIFSKEISVWINQEKKWKKCVRGSLEQDYKQFRQSQGDIYSNIPKDIVKTICLCYDVSKIDKVKNLREDLMTQYETQIEQKKKADKIQDVAPQYDTIPEQIAFLNETQIILSQQYLRQNNAISNITNFCGSAFISFKYQHYRDHIISKFTLDKAYFTMKGQSLKISKAPAPSDILWENLVVSKSSRRQRIFLSFCILLVFLLFAFGVLLGSDRVKEIFLREIKEAKQFDESDASGINWAEKSITLGITVITLIINYVLQLFSYGLTKWEKHKTKAHQKLSLVAKLLAAQFLNTSMMFLVISIIDKEDQEGLLSSEGLVYKISYLLVMSGAVQILMNICNFGALFNNISLRIFEWGTDDKEKVNMFQINLNKKYEYTEFDIAQRYSYYLVQLYTVSFYAYIVPLCVPAVALILFCQFWVDKFNLFKRSSLHYELNYSLSRNILKIAECSITIYSIGAVSFSYWIEDEVNKTLIVSMCIGIAYLVLILIMPVEYERNFFQSYEKCEVYSYDECLSSGNFTETYWNKNPATMLTEQKYYSQARHHKSFYNQNEAGTDDEESHNNKKPTRTPKIKKVFSIRQQQGNLY